MKSTVRSRLAGALVAGAIAGGTVGLASAPAWAATYPQSAYVAQLSPYLFDVTGQATLTKTAEGWSAAAKLTGLTAGDTYTYEATLASNYVDGQPHSFKAVVLCSFVATGVQGSCRNGGVHLGQTVLSPQSGAFVYSPEAHTSVADGQFSYQAVLAPYDGLSHGGTASLLPNPDGTWSGQAKVSGLTPGASYTWAVDVVEAYANGQPVSFNRIVLGQFVASAIGTGGCSVTEVSIEGRTDLPSGSSSDVASTVTSVASGTLY